MFKRLLPYGFMVGLLLCVVTGAGFGATLTQTVLFGSQLKPVDYASTPVALDPIHGWGWYAMTGYKLDGIRFSVSGQATVGGPVVNNEESQITVSAFTQNMDLVLQTSDQYGSPIIDLGTGTTTLLSASDTPWTIPAGGAKTVDAIQTSAVGHANYDGSGAFVSSTFDGPVSSLASLGFLSSSDLKLYVNMNLRFSSTANGPIEIDWGGSTYGAVDVMYDYSKDAVPEPMAMTLCGTGLLLLGISCRKLRAR